MTSAEDGESTPPHHPTYRVELTDETISTLIHHSLPSLAINFRISRFPHGTSFNNKIYKIEPDDEISSDQSYILKVNGRFFGAAKVENEVSCLLLVNQWCSDIPIPRVVSWSADGINITRWDAYGNLELIFPHAALPKVNMPGWILMTCLPGSRMDCGDLSLETKTTLSVQLGTMLSSWRQNIPKSLTCANLHFQPSSTETAALSLYEAGAPIGLQLHVYGFLEYGNDLCPPIASLLDYWKTELEWHVNKLSTESVYTPNREPLLPPLRMFLDKTLPQLPLLQHRDDFQFVFTHGDLFPRNILVQGDPPKISGIVDFEFSGFHPAMHEFTQEWLPNSDASDWPSDMYEMILEELDRQDKTSPRTLSRIEWKQIKSLNLLRNYIALWWLAEGGEEKQEMQRQLREAREKVEEAVSELNQIVMSQPEVSKE